MIKDILRLDVWRADNLERYFVGVASSRASHISFDKNGATLIQNICETRGGRPSRNLFDFILPIDSNKRVVDMQMLQNDFGVELAKFQNGFGLNSLPRKLEIELTGKCLLDEVFVGVWRVKRPRACQQFDARESTNDSSLKASDFADEAELLGSSAEEHSES